ncbi:hypothetical protein C8Q75DRAFT_787621 [Abortiporus biennis]|nr:hypothetical protein C8Q75DRAFT_787621 [Abortiporus biennis]
MSDSFVQDQRNHGERLVSGQANYAWAKDDTNNDKHAIDMYAIQTGTSKDVSFLIDFLPPYLFPSGERFIKEFIVSGFSLGGHSTWITLRDDPRVRIGIPIIGCADYLSLISERATLSGLSTGPPHIPDSLKELVLRNDPVNSPYHVADSSNPFFGKKILALSGGIDKAVPWSHTVPFFEKLEVGPEGVKESVVSPGVGHTVTPEMLSRLVDFIWAHALKP